MKDIFTCTFFGHRDFNAHFQIEDKLEEIIREIIIQNKFVEFLVGMNGEFDRFVCSVIRRVKKNLSYSNSYLILVLPYSSAKHEKNMEYYLNFYDEVEICDEASAAHFKTAITVRNKKMIDRAALVICYINHNSGGAYNAALYAEKTGKTILNLAIS